MTEIENQSVAQAWHGSGVLWGNTSWDLPDQRWVVQSQLAMNTHLQDTLRIDCCPEPVHKPPLSHDQKKDTYSGLELLWHTDILRAQHASLCPLRCQISQKYLFCSTGAALCCAGSGEMWHSLIYPLPGGQQLFLSYSFAPCLYCKSNLLAQK